MGQYICPHPDYDFIDPKTQQPKGCTKENKAKVLCLAADGLICTETKNNTFKKDISCKWTNGYSFETSLLLSIFLGMFGADRFYLGYPALGLLKLSTLGFLFLGQFADVILIATQIVGPADGSHYVMPYYGAGIHIDIDDKSNKNYGAQSYSSTSKSKPHPCRTNQYFDVDKGQCLSVYGGGKALYINNTKSCGTNVLKPHCTNPRYYYQCKEDKTILVQCPQHRHFESRLQKCVLVSHEEYASTQLKSNASNLAKPFDCHKQGSYPVPNNCGLFYTCTIYGYRMYQNFYTCPKNMVYDAEMEMCKPSSTCQQSNQPLCSDNNGKEIMTLEEAEKPMHPSKMISTGNNEKSMMCETIFTNDEETTTTTPYNDHEIILTTASYTEPSVSQFPGTSDSNAIVITTERASEMSRSTNIHDSVVYTTEMYSTNPKETMLNHEANSATEMGRNEESEITTSRGPMEEEHSTIAMEKTDEQSITEIGDINTTPLILDDPTTSSTNAEVQQTSAERNSCESCLEMTTTAEPETEIQRGTEISSTVRSPEIYATQDPISEEQRDVTPESEIIQSTSTEFGSTDVPAAVSVDPTLSNTEENVQRGTELSSDEPSKIGTSEQPNAKQGCITTAAKIIQQPTTNILRDSTTPGYTGTETQGTTEVIPTDLSLGVSSNEKPNLEEQQNASTTEESKEESTTEIGTTDVTPIISTGTTMANKVITDRNKKSEHDNRETDEQGSVDFAPTISPSTESGDEDAMFGSTHHNNLDRVTITESPSLVSTGGEPLLEDNSTADDNIAKISTRMSNVDVTESTDKIFTDSVTNSADPSSTLHYSGNDFALSTSTDAANYVDKMTESIIKDEKPTENFTPPLNTVSTDPIFVGNNASGSTTVSASSTIDNSFVDSTSTAMSVTTFSINDVSESSTLPVLPEPSTKENTLSKKEESNTSPTTESNIMGTDFSTEVNTMFTIPNNSNLDNVEHVTEGFTTSSTDTSINETGKSVSQEDGLSTTTTTKEMNTDSTSNNTTRPSKFNFINKKSHFKSLYRHLYSWIADKKNAFHQNKSIVEKDSVMELIHTYSIKTMSQNIILSIASVVLSIADKLRHHIQRILTKIL
ncbi:hypothetical protein WN48_00889 [Eufriesea mexicana]|nr:hypothetical protein WN48_00889 [Eufriesea mexicana]